MTDAMPGNVRAALTQMAAGVRLQRIKAGWILFPPDSALPIRLPQTAAQWIIGRGYARAIKRSPTRASYEITDLGRARLVAEAQDG